MHLPTLPYILLAVIWFALIAYAAFGGADFGAGIWNLLATGPLAREQHDLIDHALGPVWETNHVWLVFLVVGLFSCFPVPFSIIAVVLFIPLTLALLGTVLRGSAFVFRTHGLKSRPVMNTWTRIFSISSVLTPFFLGLCAAAVAGGQIHVKGEPMTDLGPLWLTPFALAIGCMALGLCATLAAIYLTVEATNEKQTELAELYRWRGLVAGAITAVLGAIGLGLSSIYAPLLWHGMLDHTLPLVIATMIIGVITAVTLYLRYYRLARIFIVGETAFLLGSWGVSQIPYLIPPDITVDAGASSSDNLLLMLIGIIIGMAIVLPSIYFLFYILKLKNSMGLLEKAPE
ncbi:cytochrome d ubiquinol oxidase subunit II [Tengunoibacter tsumagoiensis]|uniref:Cytochrome D ubiquinol oxidase subunit II n=1 Tax=Tengunoibacter tsumagoiensis TaxID=2014871 RepID=A0A401ZWP3_9CHLR|nr:cytochrome d ubiquinol oxidase subunit II [Tengunoibacter tsumagoiensis]GCE11154.1 cytochrome D ubiquinol oxidase subunit II [Tengunoibacter tsumagoiensis]